MARGQAPILLRGQVKKNDTAQWRRWGKKSKVLKPPVTASYSAALGTLRKQTWRNKSISLKSFLFQSFQLVGHFVSLDLRSLLSRVLLDSSQANLFPVFFVIDWVLLCLCPNPSSLSANPGLSSLSRAKQNFPGGPVLRICLPMQGTQVWSLLQENSRAGPVCLSYWAGGPWSLCSTRVAATMRSPCAATRE